MPNTSNQQLPYPSLGEAANGPAAIQSLAQSVEGKLVQNFTSASDRGTRLPAPTEGMLTYLRDTDRLEMWDGATWQVACAVATDAALTYTSPWVAYTTAGFVAPRVKRFDDGLIRLRGMLTYGTGTLAATANTVYTLATLPAGYAPADGHEIIAVHTSSGAGSLRIVGSNVQLSMPVAVTFSSSFTVSLNAAWWVTP